MIAAFMVPQKRDFISRDDAKMAAWTILEGMGVSAKHNERLVEEVDAVVDDIPAADVRPVARGAWIYNDSEQLEDVFVDTIQCSCCGECVDKEIHIFQYCIELEYRYCPNCGAKMEGS